MPTNTTTIEILEVRKQGIPVFVSDAGWIEIVKIMVRNEKVMETIMTEEQAS